MNNISLTVPMDKNALTRAAEMLQGLASDLSGEPVKVETHEHAPSVGASTTAVDDQHVTEPAATEVFAQQPEATPSPSLFAEQPAEAPKQEAAETATTAAATDSAQPAETTANAATTVETPEPAQNATAPAGVDLAPSVNTGTLIPWDARIHAGSKAKLAKKPHGWKMKRGVSDELVDQVEAELIAAMKASPANPVESTPAPPASEPTPAAPAQPAAPTGAVTTFPALMSAITSNKIDQATVTAAVNKAGLQSLPLLAARPDLIPTVAAELGFGG